MRLIAIIPAAFAITLAAGCGAANGGASTPPTARAIGTPPASAATVPGCAAAVRIISEIRLHPERLGEHDGRQSSVWAGQFAAEVMPTELAQRNEAVANDLHGSLTRIAIAFPEDTPQAVQENRPKIDADSEAILRICQHAD